ncbi:hypothetical protein POF50_012940 [Streptomyces sp. SL13]|uniref:Uncharacterized protein n=1 Tax=Streptantibioticus silvisoli TaxID=2705255 RepID=A0AA90H958_9ACTN|nr:hypothetical protein [Streptantibioticus silvisoli]MDI5970237.1 hypothetical protein [Streptantibioticus silvisoli]
MGYTVLYIAFGVVALWLLAEVLLQHKARLRWRLLAFTGFLGVAAGVAASQVILIVVGALAFGTGQTFVTLSHRRGFSTGWALGGKPGSSRRRRGTAADGPGADPDADLGAGPVGPPGAADPFAEPAAGQDLGATATFEAVDASGTSDGFDGFDTSGSSGSSDAFDAFDDGTRQTAATTAATAAYDAGYEGAYGGGYEGGHQDSYADQAPYGAQDSYGERYDASGGTTYDGAAYDGAPDGAPETDAPVYSPTPLPDDTGEYGVYAGRSSHAGDPYGNGTSGYGADAPGTGWPAAPDDDVFANGAPAHDPSYAAGYAAPDTAGQPSHDPSYAPYPADPYAPQPDYGTDPYRAQQQPGAPLNGYPQSGYGQTAYQQPQYGTDGYPQDPYQQQQQQQPYGYDAAPQDGTWTADPYAAQQQHIPQQGTPAPAPDEQPPDDPYGQQPHQQYESYQGYGY